MNRLLTPKFEGAIKDYPLYSQDGKARDAVCVAIFTIGISVGLCLKEAKRETIQSFTA